MRKIMINTFPYLHLCWVMSPFFLFNGQYWSISLAILLPHSIPVVASPRPQDRYVEIFLYSERPNKLRFKKAWTLELRHLQCILGWTWCLNHLIFIWWWLEHEWMMTSPIAGMIIQSDELHHFSEGLFNHQLVWILAQIDVSGCVSSTTRYQEKSWKVSLQAVGEASECQEEEIEASSIGHTDPWGCNVKL